MRKGWIVCLAVVVTVISSLLLGQACGSAADLVKVTVAEGMQPPAAPLYVAAEKGFWKAEGLDVELRSFTMGRLCLDAVLGGRADAGFMAETPPLLAAFKDQPIRLVTAFESSSRNAKALVRKDAGIKEPADLKDKKVGCSIGTNGEYFMSAFLSAKGVDRKSLKIINLSPADMVTAIAQGGVEAIFTWEPHITNAKVMLGDKGEIWFSDVYREGFFLGVTEDYAKKNPQIIKALLKGLIKAEQFIKENPDEAIQITSKKVNMQPEVLKSTWQYYNFKISLENAHLQTLTSEAKWAREAGIAPRDGAMPDFRKILYSEPLKELDPARVDLK